MDKDQWLGFFRDFLKLIGGALTTNGLVSSADWTTWTGLALMLFSLGWSAYERTKARRVAKVNAMPEVAGVVTKDSVAGLALANSIPSPTVVPAGTIAATNVAQTTGA